jgi:hypothetical protein
VAEHPQGFDHVGSLVSGSPGSRPDRPSFNHPTVSNLDAHEEVVQATAPFVNRS